VVALWGLRFQLSSAVIGGASGLTARASVFGAGVSGLGAGGSGLGARASGFGTGASDFADGTSDFTGGASALVVADPNFDLSVSTFAVAAPGFGGGALPWPSPDLVALASFILGTRTRL